MGDSGTLEPGEAQERMEVLAIRHAGGLGAQRAEALAAALGIGLYEARRHLAQPGPRVVAIFADADRARGAADTLRAAGFEPLVVAGDTPLPPFLVRGFEFGGQALAVEDRHGARLRLLHAHVEALVRGVRIAADAPDREPFIEVHTAGGGVLLFREGHLRYDGLHLEREPTAAANFARLLARLREAAPHAACDERLLTRAGQLQVLGDVLAPEAHLALAARLLVAAHRTLRPAA